MEEKDKPPGKELNGTGTSHLLDAEAKTRVAGALRGLGDNFPGGQEASVRRQAR